MVIHSGTVVTDHSHRDEPSVARRPCVGTRAKGESITITFAWYSGIFIATDPRYSSNCPSSLLGKENLYGSSGFRVATGMRRFDGQTPLVPVIPGDFRRSTAGRSPRASASERVIAVDHDERRMSPKPVGFGAWLRA